jgi:hypothetical protein
VTARDRLRKNVTVSRKPTNFKYLSRHLGNLKSVSNNGTDAYYILAPVATASLIIAVVAESPTFCWHSHTPFDSIPSYAQSVMKRSPSLLRKVPFLKSVALFACLPSHPIIGRALSFAPPRFATLSRRTPKAFQSANSVSQLHSSTSSEASEEDYSKWQTMYEGGRYVMEIKRF